MQSVESLFFEFDEFHLNTRRKILEKMLIWIIFVRLNKTVEKYNLPKKYKSALSI